MKAYILEYVMNKFCPYAIIAFLVFGVSVLTILCPILLWVSYIILIVFPSRQGMPLRSVKKEVSICIVKCKYCYG